MILLLTATCCGCSLSSQEKLTSDFCDHLLACDIPPQQDAGAKEECVEELIDDVSDGKVSWANIGRCEGCLDPDNNNCADTREDRDCDVACAEVPLVTRALSSFAEVDAACSQFEDVCRAKGSECKEQLQRWRLGSPPGDENEGSRLFQNDAVIHACAQCINELELPDSCTDANETCADVAKVSQCELLTSVCAEACNLSPVLGGLVAESRRVVSLCARDWSCLEQPSPQADDATSDDAGAAEQPVQSGDSSMPPGDMPMHQYRRWSPYECYNSLWSSAECRECVELGAQCAAAVSAVASEQESAAGTASATCGESSSLCRNSVAQCPECFADLQVNRGFKVR